MDFKYASFKTVYNHTELDHLFVVIHMLATADITRPFVDLPSMTGINNIRHLPSIAS
jgi:hypothetical protein